jgi:uncharacterized protein YceK
MIFLIALMLIVVSGCSKTRKSALPIEKTGFLTDYSLLTETDSKISSRILTAGRT